MRQRGDQSRGPGVSAADGDPREIEEECWRLAVGSDHRTEAMRDGGRGTVPGRIARPLLRLTGP